MARRQCRAWLAILGSLLLCAFAAAAITRASPVLTVASPDGCKGTLDATQLINQAIATAPDGATVQLAPGCMYLSNDTVHITHPVTLDGNRASGTKLGSTNDSVPARCATFVPSRCPEWWMRFASVSARPHVSVWATHDVTVRNLVIGGAEPVPAVYDSGREGQAGVSVGASARVTIDNVRVHNVYGDGIENWWNSTALTETNDTLNHIGRQGVSFVGVSGLVMDNTALDQVARTCFDFEPQVAGMSNDTMTITHTTVGWEGCGGNTISATTPAGSVNQGIAFDGLTSVTPLKVVWKGPPEGEGPVSLTNFTGGGLADPGGLFGVVTVQSVNGLTVHNFVQPTAAPTWTGSTSGHGVQASYCQGSIAAGNLVPFSNPSAQSVSGNTFAPTPKALWFVHT